VAPSAKALTLRPVVDEVKYDVLVLGRRLGTVTRGAASAMFESRWGTKKMYGSFIEAVRDLGRVAEQIAGREAQL
jgi:hypothetical protein